MRLRILDIERVAPMKERFRKRNPDTSRKPMGKNYFWYLPVKWQRRPGFVDWLLIFYETVGVVATTGLPETEDHFDYLRTKDDDVKKPRKGFESGLILEPPESMVDFLAEFHSHFPNWPKN